MPTVQAPPRRLARVPGRCIVVHGHANQQRERRDAHSFRCAEHCRLYRHSTLPCHVHPSLGRLMLWMSNRSDDLSRAGSPPTTMTSPGLSEVLVTCDWVSWVIDPHSSAQVLVEPSLSVTSIRMNECGFRHTNSFTTPWISTFWAESYVAENE